MDPGGRRREVKYQRQKRTRGKGGWGREGKTGVRIWENKDDKVKGGVVQSGEV